jgi:chromosomal replication initiation ATPase DnaA
MVAMMGPGIVKAPAWDRWGWMVESVAARHGVSVEDILGRARTKLISEARHDLMACLWGSGLAFAEIGRMLDRDHTTIISGVRRAI